MTLVESRINDDVSGWERWGRGGVWGAIAAISLSAVAMLYGGACAWLWWRQPQFVFAPSREVTQTPTEFGIEYEEFWVPVGTADERLHGWWLRTPDARGTVLYFHGNAENLGSNLRRMTAFARWGYEVVAVDYRGYGRSDGPFPNEARVYEDARATWRHVTTVLDRDPARTIVWGHSLGGAIAIELATQTPAMGALVVEASFTAIADLAKETGSYGWFPVDSLVHQRFASREKVASLTMPTLYVHGTEDELIPPAMSDRLAARTPRSLGVLKVDGADHNGAIAQGGDRLRRAVEELWAARSLARP